jgi:hypothetical protein
MIRAFEDEEAVFPLSFVQPEPTRNSMRKKRKETTGIALSVPSD